MKKFADFIRNYEMSGKPTDVKVGLIDDGVDGTYEELNRNISRGQSYFKREQDLWNPYYHSTHGHGTFMAHLIRRMSPHVKLYVAKLAEESTEDGTQIVASSAAKVCGSCRNIG